MSTEDRSVDDLLLEAIRLQTGEQRAAFLDAECGRDIAKRQRLERLIHAYIEAGSFLESPAPPIAPTVDKSSVETPGAQIGNYKLLQEIGHGGMGVVYMAEQTQPVERRVALKIIKPGMDSRQVIARFEAERQALAMMDHPNIAKALDAGTTESGRLYFVMELVKGLPVTRYCDEQHLSPRDRLQLFMPICQAVQHAHQKGIIHRDLKPSNVLVALYDGQPIPKVIDFGVAKAMHQRLTEKTMFTQFGQVVGTLEYMSPEQAQVNELDVDTRSDVYSLGVLLYELLTGTTPFEGERLRSAAFDEMMRIIREEEPPRPSMRLSTIDTLPSVAANRRTEPRRLRKLVRGELDWIVMKALEKDRARRYETASGFAADIRRYLDHEAVVACPPTMGYRLRKLARRHKAAIATTAVIAIALVVGLIGTSWQAWRATVAERTVRHQRDTAQRKKRESDAMRFAAQSAGVPESHPVRSLLLAAAGVEATRKFEEAVIPVAHQALLHATASITGSVVEKLGTVSSVAFSGDGRWLVVKDGSRPGLVAFRGGSPGDTTLELPGYRSFQGDISVGTRWAVGSGHGTEARLWDLEAEAAEFLVLAGHHTRVVATSISPDERWAVTGSWDGDVRLWDLTTPDPSLSSQRLAGHERWIYHMSFTPDSRYLVTASDEGLIQRWDLASTAPAASALPVSVQENRRCCAISPDGRWLATSEMETTRIWDLTSPDPFSLAIEGGSNEALFSSDGKWLVTIDGRDIRRWDVTAPDLASTAVSFSGHKEDIQSAMISPDSQWLVTGSNDNTARVWDLSSPAIEIWSHVLRGHEDWVYSLAICPKSQRLVTASSPAAGEPARLWNLSGVEPPGDLVHGPAAFSPDGRSFVSAQFSDNSVRVHSLSERGKREQLAVLPRQTAAVTGLAISADSRQLATSRADKVIRIWNLAANRPTNVPRVIDLSLQPDDIRTMAFSSNGRSLFVGIGSLPAVVENEFEVQLWDISTDPPIRGQVLTTETVISSIEVSADGRWLAVVPRLNAPTLWSKTTLWNIGRNEAPSFQLSGHRARILDASFSADSHWFATASADGTVRIWDLNSSDPAASPRVLRGHRDQVFSVEFSPDGRWLATGAWASRDNSSRLWDLSAEDPNLTSRVLLADGGGALTVAFSADSRRLVSVDGFRPSTAHLWDLRTEDPASSKLVLGEVAVSHSPHPPVAFTADSRSLIAASRHSGVPRVWDLDMNSLVNSTRRLAGRQLTADEWTQYGGSFDDYFQALNADPGTVTRLNLRDTRLTDAELPRLQSLTELISLDLSGTLVTDAGLVHLKGLKKLEHLYLTSMAVSGEGLVHLAEPNRLKLLVLVGSDVTDRGLEEIGKLTNLSSLYLADCRTVSDVGLNQLARLDHLERLDLSSTGVTDKGLAHLSGFRHLRRLWLNATATTDVGLEHIKELGSLEDLHLNRTHVTDAGIQKLSGLSNLGVLRLGHTKVSDEVFKHLGRMRSLTNLMVTGTQVTRDAGDVFREGQPYLHLFY